MYYSSEDLYKVKKIRRKISLSILAISIVMLALIVLSFLYRYQVLSVLLSVIYLSITFFIISLFYIPVKKYSQFINSVLEHMQDNKKTISGKVIDISDSKMVYDGIECYAVTILTGQDIHGDITAIIYIDAQKSLKNIKNSDNLNFVLFDRYIIDVF